MFPAEIWTQVHFWACTADDGQTGRSLSLVSRDWRELSAPFKLQSIALVGAKPILRFLALLESTPEGLRNVESLFIGCQNLRLYSYSGTHLDLAEELGRGLSFTAELFPELGITPFTKTPPISNHAIEKCIGRILERVAGTLHTLHTHLIFLQRPRPLYSVPLPHLFSLVLYGPFQSPHPSTSAHLTPRLRRLRLVPPAPSPHQGSPRHPVLSHLFLTYSACSRKELERALEDTNLRKLTRLVVEVGVSRRSRSPPGGGSAADSLERVGLLRLARTDGRVRIVKEKPWWMDVQAACIEWENVDEMHWDEREGVERN
ncbi:hypothetical protein FB45DRAFT_915493 [Roridomyces roridus]|uniref:Uncharacterized protein n=1 Tax=Roridomyces roridus TaxID=1738132 RepID=A0AAD7BTP7_9AGAR|nr:hypothetical protein FB45DRAFT_915493 [Roridomyces roridus]